jgi:predicted DNA-binding protein with PD1-like motif
LILKQGKISRALVERFNTGDDVLDRLNSLVRQQHVFAGSFTALGAVESGTVGYFIGDGNYFQISLEGPLEVVSCVGNVSSKEGAPFVHAHITFSDKEGKAYGGHLLPGCRVGATFEVTLHTYDDIDMPRIFDPATKLFLLKL